MRSAMSWRAAAMMRIARLVGALVSGLQHRGASEMVVDLARAKLDLARIRAARQQMLAPLLECPLLADAKQITGLDRYERAALVRQRRALQCLRAARG